MRELLIILILIAVPVILLYLGVIFFHLPLYRDSEHEDYSKALDRELRRMRKRMAKH